MTGPVCHPEYEDWSDLPSSLVSDCLGRFSAMASAIRPITGVGMVGPAYTLQGVVGDNLSIHFALANVPAGSVLVIDAGGYEDRAVWGEVLAVAAEQQGILGVVIDGSIRDRDGLTARRFPVYARGTSPAGPHKAGGGREQVTVSCGGVPVSPGDLIVADGDGVVVVPHSRTREIHALASERSALEQEWMNKIMSGMPSPEVLGLDRSKR
ncbi:MAG TPA: RraA family protein [Microbacteriaceae bacterium]